MESLNKAFISIETTGLNSSNDKIIEIAILKIDQNNLKSLFHQIINDERIEYFIDAKGIHPNAKQTPRFKPRADLKFINRDRVIRRIVSIVHNGKIKFVEGFHSNYKNLEEKYIKII